MTAAQLSKTLGYDGSGGWISGDALRALALRDHPLSRTMHACRHFGGALWGVYLLRSNHDATPTTYVIDAPSEEAADEIHRRVWNQDVAPFLLVAMPDAVRVCTGFRYEAPGVSDAQRGVLHAALRLDEVGAALDDLRAEQIDAGVPWRLRADALTGEHRVDARLLRNLRSLREELLRDGLPPPTAHALIGRFLYLRHLLDRGVLDARRIASLGVNESEAFGRHATVRGLRRLVEAVDERLNGSVFPLIWTGEKAPHDRHVRAVAGAFLGDEVQSGQRHLNFRAYDFSYLPVETLSVVYEQFLTRLDEDRDKLRGQARKALGDGPTRREAGAFYTPLPLVNFVLNELDDARPMTASTRVLDPSCGSGAFLVQCFRRLVTRWCEAHPGVVPTAAQLRELLTENIFGIDPNEDACRVTEFSLALALLDHLPDAELSLARGFRLPTLHERNVFVGDFFDVEGAWRAQRGDGFDWIVGNPPWVGVTGKGQEHALAWVERDENKDRPVVAGRVAEAFAWEAPRHLRADGRVGFVLPGMTLFSDSNVFRKRFFGALKVDAVTNLANLRRVLFDGRASQPAAVLVYGATAPEEGDGRTLVYSPLLIHQAATVGGGDRRARVWTLCLNQSEVIQLRQTEIARGDGLTWKLAMWGSPYDERLLQRMVTRCGATLGDMKSRGWVAHDGVELRPAGTPGAALNDEIVGKHRLLVEAVEGQRQFHSFPSVAITDPIPPGGAYLRAEGHTGGVHASRGPHVIVSRDYRFAVYVNDFLLVTHPTLSIAAPDADRDLAKALALYLNSRAARYFQFMVAPQEGVKSGRITLTGLMNTPNPLLLLSDAERRAWVELHDDLAQCSKAMWRDVPEQPDEPTPRAVFEAPDATTATRYATLRRDLDELVSKALHLREADRWHIDDLLDVKLHLVDGLTRPEAVGPPDGDDLQHYAEALCQGLDAFYDERRAVHHGVTVVRGDAYACAQVARVDGASFARVVDADGPVARALARVHARVRRENPQWIYFDRNLRVYEGDAMWFFKPLQRLAWTRSQGRADAGTLIAEVVAAGSNA